MRQSANINHADRSRGAVWGAFIGDALAMPVHWYYNTMALKMDYGTVRDYVKPKNPHPDSILFRSSYTPFNKKGDILHDQAQYWGQQGIHYHQFLQAGENTLNLKLTRLLIDSLNELGQYDADDYLDRFISFMTTPGNHQDTYVEEYLRNFFDRYARGAPPNRCGGPEKHIGGLAGLAPIVVCYQHHPEPARQKAREHLALTHQGPAMEEAADWFINVMLKVLEGEPLLQVLKKGIAAQAYSFYQHPFEGWLSEPDERVIGQYISPACYVPVSIPAVIYLAMKYHHDPESALVANTNVGGDNVYRGVVLGALLGAENGLHAFPESWRTGLLDPPPDVVAAFSADP
jgi:ADP-ribosyl-[dinitrogen reductase] hydrolase